MWKADRSGGPSLRPLSTEMLIVALIGGVDLAVQRVDEDLVAATFSTIRVIGRVDHLHRCQVSCILKNAAAAVDRARLPPMLVAWKEHLGMCVRGSGSRR